MMRSLLLLMLLTSAVVAGCAEIAPPTPGQVLESPFGKGPLRAGMTKDEVMSLWGEPDEVERKEPDRWGSTREIWIYRARMPGVPVDAGYVSKTKVLEFDGSMLVAFHD